MLLGVLGHQRGLRRCRSDGRGAAGHVWLVSKPFLLNSKVDFFFKGWFWLNSFQESVAIPIRISFVSFCFVEFDVSTDKRFW